MGKADHSFAVDLQTGKVLWQSNAIAAGSISFGYIYDSQQPNQKGVMQPILFTSNFAQAYDAYTGTYLFNVTNIPNGGPVTMGPNGETIKYVVSNGLLSEWNSSALWNWNILVGGGVPQAATTNFNVTTPASAFGPASTTSYFNTVNGNASQTYDLERFITNQHPKHFHPNRSFLWQHDIMRKWNSTQHSNYAH